MKKKILAFGLAACLALSSSVLAYGADATAATDGTISGSGSIEGYVEKDLFVFTAPTTSDVNFKLDPQELLKATSGTGKIDGTAFTSATAGYGEKVMFSTATANEYASKSQDITVVNKGQVAIDVAVTAKVTGLKKDGESGYDIKMVGDTSAADFDWGTDTAISMKLTPSTNTITGTTPGTPAAVTADVKYLTADADGVTVKETVAAAPDTAFELKKDGSGVYAYNLKADVSSIAFNEVIFNLEGAVNADANWKNYSADTSSALKVELAYTIDKHSDVPPIVENLTSDGTTDIVIETTEADVTSFTMVKGSKTSAQAANAANWSSEGNKLTLKATWIAAMKKASTWGAGSYSVKIGESTYNFTIS